jgi:NAD(P)-dependent dehydrogenase (short-subunit alcohol dehydrogenase family)
MRRSTGFLGRVRLVTNIYGCTIYTMLKKNTYWTYGIAVVILVLVGYFLRRYFIHQQDTHTIADIFKRAQIPPGSKTAMVTGGASGIGYAYCDALMTCGYNVVIADIHNAESSANTLRNKFSNTGVTVSGIYCDVGNLRSMTETYKKASNSTPSGVFDVLILNAGIDLPIYQNDQQIIQTNLLGPMYGVELYVKQITKGLKEKAQIGSDLQIIITGSLASFIPIDMNLSPAYDASKAGVGQLVRSYKSIATRYGFRINAVCPAGLVETGLTKHFIDTTVKRLQVSAYQNTEGRGGIMQPSQIVPAMLEVLTNKTYNGDLIAVNPNLGHIYRLEPRDENNAFDEYGVYDENKSFATKSLIDYRIKVGI